MPRSIHTLQKKYQSSVSLNNLDSLLSLATRETREALFSHPERPVTLLEYGRFLYFLRRFKKGYSIAVLRGHKEFFGLDFIVTPATLVPRPDTELLVESALKIIKSSTQKIVLIDIGTGTGCIPISILKNVPEKITTLATDIAGQSLTVAKKNAERHSVSITFLRGNLLQPVLPLLGKTTTEKNEYSLIITANLPYLKHEQFLNEPSIQREPYRALVAENEGLARYDELFQSIVTDLIPRGCTDVTLLCEIDPSQTASFSTLVKKYAPEATLDVRKDLAGFDRTIIISFPK
jgi:release factor glutamine methyltransferase